VNTGLQALLDKEGLTEDSIKLHNYNSNNKIIKIIDEIKSELADTTDDMSELDMIYRFAEKLKDRLGGIWWKLLKEMELK